MTQEVKKLLEHYRSLGAGPELDLFRSLYRCLMLEERLAQKARGQPPK
jgi:hypothetical protein